MNRVVQLMAGFADGDAISREALSLHRMFGQLGLDSKLFADDGHISPTMTGTCRPLSEYRAGPNDLVIHHYGIDAKATGVFLATPGKKIVLYHNITPADFFRGYDDDMVVRLERGRAQLRDVLKRVDAVWTVSEYNATELREMGRADVSVFPLLFDPSDYSMPPDPRILGFYEQPMMNILFVGRIAPNKSVEDLINALAWYKKTINDKTRLTIVGSFHGTPRYAAMLRLLMHELDLPHVTFEGFASDKGLVAYYKAADVFVCPSRHEGYCLPLIEAMHHGVPVIARNSGGMPEAMNGAGILYDDMDPNQLAELIRLTVEDNALRQRVLDSQNRRMQELTKRDPLSELRVLLKPFS